MKIISLQAENLKRLVAVEITPTGALVEITGKNGSGKSSALDAIWWALSGARHIQAAPIRKGANQAKIRLDMGELIVTRRFQRTIAQDGTSEGYTTKLEVVGNVKGSPQAMLDSLLDALAFDPLAFSRMSADDQFKAIKKYVPDVDFDKLTAANSIDFANRAEKNKRAKEERVQADKIELNVPVGERIDETALISQLTEAGRTNADIQMREEKRRQFAQSIEADRVRAKEIRAQAEHLFEKARTLDGVIAAAEEKLENAAALPALVDVTALQADIQKAKGVNAQVDLLDRKKRHETAAVKFESEAKELTNAIVRRDTEKVSAIAAAKLPVEALTIGEGIVLLNGVPFDQASDAEKLRASCALAMAGNPELRVIRVKDGSLLDSDSIKILADMVKDRDFQLWLEIATDGEPRGFVIEEGKLKSSEPPAETVPVQEKLL